MLLVLKAGSSSIKFALYELPLDDPPAKLHPHLGGQIAGIGRKVSFVAAEKALPVPQGIADHASAIAWLLDWLEVKGLARHLWARAPAWSMVERVSSSLSCSIRIASRLLPS
jgi:acetate kinase